MMKIFFALTLIATVVSAGVIKPTAAISSELAEILVAAINHPSTDPATAVALKGMRYEMLGLAPISVGPTHVDGSPVTVVVIAPKAIGVGPAIVGSPAPEAVEVAPIAMAYVSDPLVEIILDIKQAPGVSSSHIDSVVEMINVIPYEHHQHTTQ